MKIKYIIVLLTVCYSCNESSNQQSKVNRYNNLGSSIKEDESVEYSYLDMLKEKNITDSTRFVLIKPGLSLYQSQDTTSKVVTDIKVGERVEILEDSKQKIEVSDLKGSIVKVSYKDTIGYIFSGGLGHYPIPSFANKREHFIIGDFKRYFEELHQLNLSVSYESGCLTFPKLDGQQAYLISQLLFPGLMSNVPILKDQIKKDEDAETMSDFNIHEGNFGNDKAYFLFGNTSIFFSNYVNDSGMIEWWEYYFFFSEYKEDQATINFEISDEGGFLCHNFTK